MLQILSHLTESDPLAKPTSHGTSDAAEQKTNWLERAVEIVAIVEVVYQPVVPPEHALKGQSEIVHL